MTYDEAMARLRAVEALPVGERLARWCAPNAARPYRLPSLRRMVNRMNSRPILSADWIRDIARPLRIARERAKQAHAWKKDYGTVCALLDKAHAQLDRFRINHGFEDTSCWVGLLCSLGAKEDEIVKIDDGRAMKIYLSMAAERQHRLEHALDMALSAIAEDDTSLAEELCARIRGIAAGAVKP